MKARFRISLLFALPMIGLWSLPVPFMKSRESGPEIVSAANMAESFTVNPKFYALNPCEKRKFTAEVKDANGELVNDVKVTWQSTNPDVAKIDDQGVAVAISPGSTLIAPIAGNAKGTPASLFVRDKGVAAKGC